MHIRITGRLNRGAVGFDLGDLCWPKSVFSTLAGVAAVQSACSIDLIVPGVKFSPEISVDGALIVVSFVVGLVCSPDHVTGIREVMSRASAAVILQHRRDLRSRYRLSSLDREVAEGEVLEYAIAYD